MEHLDMLCQHIFIIITINVFTKFDGFVLFHHGYLFVGNLIKEILN